MFATLAVAAGCHPDAPPADPLPPVPARSTADELHALADRAGRVRTVAAAGTFDLAGADGQRATYAVAVSIALPDRARLTATAGGRPAFDLTVRPDGVWLAAAGTGTDGRPSAAAVAGADAAGLARALTSLLSPAFFADPANAATDTGDELTITRGRPNESAVACHVDRRTLTPTRYELLDAVGATRFTLDLADWHAAPGGAAGGAAWPWRATAAEAAGRVALTMSAVTVNADLPADATTPPAGAERLP